MSDNYNPPRCSMLHEMMKSARQDKSRIFASTEGLKPESRHVLGSCVDLV